MKESSQIYASESFFKVYDWMVQELGLAGNELLTFAVIYDYSTRFNNVHPSQDNLSARTGANRRTIIRVLQTLKDRKLVTAIKVNGTASEYTITDKKEWLKRCDKMSQEQVTKCHNHLGQNVTPPVTNCHTPCDKMSHPLRQNVTPKEELKEEVKEEVKDKTGAHACASADPEKNLSQTSTDYDTECLNIFWKLYPETRKKTIDSIRDDFLAIPSEEYPLLLTVLHHKLFDSELGDEWRRQDGRFIPGIKRYLSDQYWKRGDNRCLVMWEYTPEGIEMNKSNPEDLQAQLSQNLKELRIL